MKNLIIVFMIITTALACKSKAELTKTEGSTSNLSYLTITFTSKGNGIYHTAYNKIDSIVKEKQTSCSFQTELIKFGREGERQICIQNIEEKCKTKLVQSLNQLSFDDRVQISDKIACRK